MRSLLLILSALILSTTSAASGQLIADDFETNSSSDYRIVWDGSIDGTVAYGYDYIAAGIPLAPRSTAGQRQGLRLTANDSAGEADAVTVFHNTALTGSYQLLVDVYMGVTGTAGTTEHAHIGVAGDGTTLNQLFSPISGSGHFVAFTGEGGSSSDYRHYVPGVGPVASGDASYLNDLNTTNATGDTYQALFPSPPQDYVGSPGNSWTTLLVDVDAGAGLITYSLDGATGMTPIIQTAAVVTDGQVSLGYGDLFSSVADPFQAQFVIYDNLQVVPEPATLGLLAIASAVLVRRRRR